MKLKPGDVCMVKANSTKFPHDLEIGSLVEVETINEWQDVYKCD